MRILIDLPEATIEQLTAISERRKLPRAAVMREALDQFVKAQVTEGADQAFGIWRDCARDGLETQRDLRSEW